MSTTRSLLQTLRRHQADFPGAVRRGTLGRLGTTTVVGLGQRRCHRVQATPQASAFGHSAKGSRQPWMTGLVALGAIIVSGLLWVETMEAEAPLKDAATVQGETCPWEF
jgi:hypothetical protein